jgi:DNA-binding NarL/FixJ family response regulator
MTKRENIVAALHAGKAIPDIIKELRVSRATIFNTKRALKD